MSLSSTLTSATSGMIAAQAGLRTVSDNIANINTPGYVRKTVDQQQMVVNGVGVGVQVAGVKRVTDQYLQMASLSATSDSSRLDVLSQYLDNAQSLFGNPASETFFFNRLDTVYSGFAAASNDPSNGLLRAQALSNVQDFLNEASRINGQIAELAKTMDTRISADVGRANDLLAQIDRLNADISRIKVTQGDASGSENIQSGLLDELSTLMNVQISQRQEGGVVVRSAEGVVLSGQGVAKLAYNRTDTTAGYISVVPPGSSASQPIEIRSGEIRGLMDLRDTSLPKMSEQLGEFVSRAVDQINAAHNAATAFPPPNKLTGRNTGMDAATALSGFSGQTTVAITNDQGVVQRQVTVDFTAGTMNSGGGPVAFTPSTFIATLNGQLGTFGSASFTDGALSIQAAATGNGVAIDEGTSAKAGRAFSAFFGLNDLIRSNEITNFETGLKPADAHGFVAGEQVTFRLAQTDGKPLRDVTITMPAAPASSMTDLLAALNNNASGVGLYGQFTLDADGALSFKGQEPTNATLSVVTDNTHHGAGGPSFSELFGVGSAVRTNRASVFQISSALMSDPTKVAMAKLDLSVAAGQPAVRAGDGSGAAAISAAGDKAVTFRAAGSLGEVSMTVSRYAAEFSGAIGREAASAATQAQSALAIQSEATARRQSVEGVNLDEELVRLTTYQQAFNASARMIQAAKDLFDVLTQMV